MLPVEPEVFERIDPRQTLSFHWPRKSATLKAPFAERIGIQKYPGIARISATTAI